ncbi:hypothetical protein [Rhodopseudomonas sp. P2A-2r]|uniref:hypothetical protein n=1 Tax=Rhodopseudomonas sp. P2A-2r TaxID=2991972 RepID=UPI0029FEF086|nr:hypothetical protein [Rhodopseudomonas sp. P2A-2r]
MKAMVKRASLILTAIIAVTLAAGGAASAQILPPGGGMLAPPPPAPPPPPAVTVPVVPQLDSTPASPKAGIESRGSFGDRVTGCLQDGAAAGLGPNERAAYSRSCANR